MNKQIGSIMLVAGTCIGSGMIALPIVMAQIGIVASFFLMLAMWLVIYFTSLVNLELNLQADKGMNLGELGKRFSGAGAEIIGHLSIKILSICLLGAYIYAGSSIIQTLIGTSQSFKMIATIYTIMVFLILLCPLKTVDYINRTMFIILILLVLLLVLGLATKINIETLPLLETSMTKFSSWRTVMPIVFTSFGFQVIFHTLTDYCNKNTSMLKKAFFWGSLIPAIVYIFWTISVLSAVNSKNSQFYQLMISGQVEAGQLIQQLSEISNFHFIQLCVWWISLLAILTSVLGVSIGLFQSYCNLLRKSSKRPFLMKILVSFSVVIIPYLLAILVPNAFIAILGFAGLILVSIAILQPIYLLYKARITKYHYPILKEKLFIISSVIAGITIIICEAVNIIVAI
jgi:tyrosine-specific transport protein